MAWTQPALLALLAVPALLLVWAWLAPRHTPRASALVALWQRVRLADDVGARGARRSPPLGVWLACASLACASLALAGPVFHAARSAALHVFVDRSPSMYLTDPARAGATRLALALTEFEQRFAGDAPRVWHEFHGAGAGSEARQLPAAWLQAPRAPRPDPDFARADRVECVWLTDRAPLEPAREAAWIASGGPAVPGPIGLDGHTRIVWDGSATLRGGDAGRPPRVCRDARLAEPLRALLASWAGARGLELVAGACVPSAELEVVFVASADATRIEVGRDGWRAAALVGALAPERAEETEPHGAPGETWLALDDGGACVRAAPGRITTSLASLDLLPADPALFAVSWSRLFDASLLPAEGVVALAERRAAGEPGAQVPTRASAGVGSRALQGPLAWLALVLAASAVFASRLSWAPRAARFD